MTLKNTALKASLLGVLLSVCVGSIAASNSLPKAANQINALNMLQQDASANSNTCSKRAGHETVP